MEPPGHYISSLRERWTTGTLEAHSRMLYSVLVFMSTTGKGFQVPYTTIILHAISRADLTPSIYCQLDESQALEEEPTQDEEAELEMRELRIIPSTPESCASCADPFASHSYFSVPLSSGTHFRGTFQMRSNESRSRL